MAVALVTYLPSLIAYLPSLIAYLLSPAPYLPSLAFHLLPSISLLQALVFHGTSDILIPYANGVQLAGTCKRAEVGMVTVPPPLVPIKALALLIYSFCSLDHPRADTFENCLICRANSSISAMRTPCYSLIE